MLSYARKLFLGTSCWALSALTLAQGSNAPLEKSIPKAAKESRALHQLRPLPHYLASVVSARVFVDLCQQVTTKIAAQEAEYAVKIATWKIGGPSRLFAAGNAAPRAAKMIRELIEKESSEASVWNQAFPALDAIWEGTFPGNEAVRDFQNRVVNTVYAMTYLETFPEILQEVQKSVYKAAIHMATSGAPLDDIAKSAFGMAQGRVAAYFIDNASKVWERAYGHAWVELYSKDFSKHMDNGINVVEWDQLPLKDPMFAPFADTLKEAQAELLQWE